MTTLQVLLLGIVATLGLVVFRTVRAGRDLPPLPDGKTKYAVVLGFLLLPPLVLGAFVGPPSTTVRAIRGTPDVLPYLAVIVALAIPMWILAEAIRFILPGRSPRLLLVALAGNAEDPDAIAVDPAPTPELASAISEVDRCNAVFPRGGTFPAQVERPSFRPDWDALDAATTALEARIAADRSRGTPVSSIATATARDARSRLETLRHIAQDHGQEWSAGSGPSTNGHDADASMLRAATDPDPSDHRVDD